MAATKYMDNKLDSSMSRNNFWKIMKEGFAQMDRVRDDKEVYMEQFIRLVLGNLTNSLLRKFPEQYLDLGARLFDMSQISRYIQLVENFRPVLWSLQNRAS